MWPVLAQGSGFLIEELGERPSCALEGAPSPSNGLSEVWACVEVTVLCLCHLGKLVCLCVLGWTCVCVCAGVSVEAHLGRVSGGVSQRVRIRVCLCVFVSRGLF